MVAHQSGQKNANLLSTVTSVGLARARSCEGSSVSLLHSSECTRVQKRTQGVATLCLAQSDLSKVRYVSIQRAAGGKGQSVLGREDLPTHAHVQRTHD